MPLYDCGNPDCSECQRAFGPDRSKAIAEFRTRERLLAEAERDTRLALAQSKMLGGLLDSIFGLPKRDK